MKRSGAVSIALAGLILTGILAAARAQAPNPQPNPVLSALDVPVPPVVSRSARLGHSDPARLLHLSVSLPPGDAQALQNYVDALSDPASPTYRSFLTPEQVGEMFGLPQQTVRQVVDYLTSQGFQIRLVARNRLNILADCTVAQAEAAFNTQIDEFSAVNPGEPGNPRFFSYSRPLSVPAALKPAILDVTGLENFTRPQFRSTLTPGLTSTLYNLSPIYSAGKHGEGRTVGISNWDGFRLSNVPLYYAQYSLPTPPGGAGSNITVVTISGGSGSGAEGAEGDLDIQMALGMAPLCNLIVYDGGNSDLIGVLTQEVNDNAADVISESYGWSLPSSTATSAHNLHLSMTAQGITYMAASGDNGTSLEPYSYPDYDPEVLMVGGTVATVGSTGTRTSEVGWSGSGGGWSTNTATFNVLPSWQKGTGVPTTVNKRLVPDVALHSSGNTSTTAGAYYFYYRGSLTGGYVGTSFASPVFAGSLAVAEQQIISLGGLPPNGAGKQRFGRIQDLIYSQNGRSDVWYDITSGSNGSLPSGGTSSAGAGWDYVTGWGAINWNAFVSTQVTTTPDFSVSASPASQSVVQGSGTSYTVTVTPANGYASSVALTVGGLPSGATGSLSPTTLTGGGTSTLAVMTSSSTPAGSYTLTITGTDGTLTHTATVTLVVTAPPTPDFSLSASPTSLSVSRSKPRGGANTTITVAPSGGFTGTVALSATGLPSGVTATFSPASVSGGSGTSNLNLLPSSNTPRGTFTITIVGTSSTLTHSTAVTLKVNK